MTYDFFIKTIISKLHNQFYKTLKEGFVIPVHVKQFVDRFFYKTVDEKIRFFLPCNGQKSNFFLK